MRDAFILERGQERRAPGNAIFHISSALVPPI
jgi:hypothetical protein